MSSRKLCILLSGQQPASGPWSDDSDLAVHLTGRESVQGKDSNLEKEKLIEYSMKRGGGKGKSSSFSITLVG